MENPEGAFKRFYPELTRIIFHSHFIGQKFDSHAYLQGDGGVQASPVTLSGEEPDIGAW